MARRRSGRIVTTVVLLLELSVLSGCAGVGGGSSTASPVEISPAVASVRAGDTLQFTAKVIGTMNQSVVWSVNGVVGGNATFGKISTTGLYTAPAALPTPDSVSIEASSASDKTLSGKTEISLENPIPTVTAISPTAVPVGSFSITISGTKFVSDAKVTLSGQTLTTKFVSSTELTATGTTRASQKDTSAQLMVENPDAGAVPSTALMVRIGAPIVVTVTPPGRNVLPGQTLQLKATVSGTTNQSVTWIINGIVGGNATDGTISTSGLYTAPKPFNPGITNVRVFATNVADGKTHGSVAGNHLDMANNDKPDPSGTQPNENYAREVLQLFSIGLAQLNPDGTQQLDTNGMPIPTYTQDTIITFAHVFTGWTYPAQPGKTAQFDDGESYGGAMVPFDSHYDTGTKLLLNGVTLPAGGSTQALT